MTLQKDNHKEIALIANLMNQIGVLRAQCDKQSEMLKVAKEGLEVARRIILDDLGTEIAEIENALSAIGG